MSPISKDSLLDSVAEINPVIECLKAIKTNRQLMTFLLHYADWNAVFAAGVTRLTSNISMSRNWFVDRSVPAAVGDRSLYIASFIFDAARDEYNDRIMQHRDPHRSLAQSLVVSAAEILDQKDLLNSVTRWPHSALDEITLEGYNGAQLDKALSIFNIFSGIGYHLGSEILADDEFTKIDLYLRQNHNDLVQALMRKAVNIHGVNHRSYSWIGIHSGGDGGAAVEQDHFVDALQAANFALELVDPSVKDNCAAAIKAGFAKFKSDRVKFFQILKAKIENIVG